MKQTLLYQTMIMLIIKQIDLRRCIKINWKHPNFWFKVIGIFSVCAMVVSSGFNRQVHGDGSAEQSEYLIGAGIYDITGPTAEIIMEGYAKSDQIAEGIRQRLRSRAFIIKDATEKSAVFVSADIALLFGGIKEGVIKKLRENGYGNQYTAENVMVSATHTHASISGCAYYAMYNLSAKGFCEQNYNAIVNGIYNSIVNADQNLEPGYIEINQGRLDGVSVNRSKPAYNNNPVAERNRYTDDVDKTMTLLNFKAANGNLIGVLNWFAVHGTSMSHHNKLISGDNKGYASYLFEKSEGTDYLSAKTFVAAFAQSNCGDVSPNINYETMGNENGAFGLDDLKNTEYEGQNQYSMAKYLSDTATARLTGPVDYRSTYVDMQNIIISPEYTSGEHHCTYAAAAGYSFGAGAVEDGPTDLLNLYEGMTQEDYPYSINSNNFGYQIIQGLASLFPYFGNIIGTNYPELWEQHYPKPILLAPSKGEPDPFVPDVVELQIIRIGQLAIIGQPGEITTMAGRRLRDTVKATLDSDGTNNTIVIAGLANEYTQYVTTPEEYDMQQYESAATFYGKWTLDAYKMHFDTLAKALVNHTSVEPGPTPRDLSDDQTTLVIGVVLDNVPIGKNFGDVVQNVNASYNKGETVTTIFWGGHPKNDLKTQSSYLEIQKKSGTTWNTLYYDWDWCATFRWTRIDAVWGTSQVTIKWTIPEDAPSGTYRIKYNGADKSGWTGKIRQHTGYSSEFVVN
jgi:neutral ceramidase